MHGAWCFVLGALCLVLGAWCLVLGAWCMVFGAWCLVLAVVVVAQDNDLVRFQIPQLHGGGKDLNGYGHAITSIDLVQS